MNPSVFTQIEALIQQDVNRRGLARDQIENLISACRGDFEKACRALGSHQPKSGDTVLICTGFFIPAARAHETDGPLGAVYLARSLVQLGYEVLLVTDATATAPLNLAVRQLGLQQQIKVNPVFGAVGFEEGDNGVPLEKITHVVAIERAGPSHSLTSLQRQTRSGPVPESEFLAHVPVEHWDQYHTMRGQIITDEMEPAHLLLERMVAARGRRLVTIGIGDGGNEIGMGKVPWEVIAKNVPGGDLVACRVGVDFNIVCGVSNWGAYGLAAGAWLVSGRPIDEETLSPGAERRLWEHVLKQATLVDGMTGQRTLSVDGLEWDAYVGPLLRIVSLVT